MNDEVREIPKRVVWIDPESGAEMPGMLFYGYSETDLDYIVQNANEQTPEIHHFWRYEVQEDSNVPF